MDIIGVNFKQLVHSDEFKSWVLRGNRSHLLVRNIYPGVGDPTHLGNLLVEVEIDLDFVEDEEGLGPDPDRYWFMVSSEGIVIDYVPPLY